MKKIIIIIIVIFILIVSVFIAWLYLFPEKVLKSISDSERGKAGLELLDVKVNGMTMKYLSGGQGEPLLLIHGFGANKDNWTRISRYLTPHFRVVAPDLIGFGESSRPKDADYSIVGQMERIRAFADKLELKKFHLGGSSMGGNISAAFASEYPEYIKSLLLLAPGGVYSAEESELISLVKQGKNPLIATDRESYNKVIDFVFYKKPFIPAPVLDAFAAEAIRNKPINDIVFKAICEKPLATDEVLQNCSIPTLVIWGKNDRALHWSGAKILGNIMRNATIIVFDETGHLPMIEKPEDTAEEFLKFSKSLSN